MTTLVFVLLIQSGLGLADLWQPNLTTLVFIHAVAALALLLALRVALHFVLLHEQHDITIGPPHVCAHCHHVVPQMPFCPHCGYASRGATRRTRTAFALDPATAETEA